MANACLWQPGEISFQRWAAGASGRIQISFLRLFQLEDSDSPHPRLPGRHCLSRLCRDSFLATALKFQGRDKSPQQITGFRINSEIIAQALPRHNLSNLLIGNKFYS